MLPLAVTIACSTAQAGIRHSDVLLQTYTDFGQNKGRYVVGARVNALLEHIRQADGGIAIPYTDGQESFIISNAQGMIDFSCTFDGGPDAAIGPNMIATVAHNGSNSASYGDRVVGSEHALNYQAIDIRGSSPFRLTAPDGMWGATHDYMLQRQSKVQTDVNWNPVSTITNADELWGDYVYHAGGGAMGDWVNGQVINSFGAYGYITGGIMSVTNVMKYGSSGSFVVQQDLWYGTEQEGASSTHPLPNAVRGGDSGSPVFIYNETTKQYEYLGAQEGIINPSKNWTAGNTAWTLEKMESFNERVDMSTETTVYLNAVSTAGETIDDGNGNSTTLYSGDVTDASGNVLASYNGVRTGVNTWKDLSDLKDTQNWYAYGNDRMQVGVTDLFYTENLVFDAAAGSENSIVLKDTVDLGVGYAEFNNGKFTITSEGTENNQFDHSGYVINKGAEVHLQLRNTDTRMTEWRKVGEGALYIDGTGNTNALLNVGGSGTTYLQQKDGYAAYNVLANSGATVQIADVKQIARDFTFGAGGGTLDMNGNSMDWYTTNTDVAADGFSINALTEEAVITNGSGVSTLTYKQSGNTTFLGSFRDTKEGTLVIDYQGGTDSTWTLNSIRTDLSNNSASGLIVSSGAVQLVGTNTVHGMGSATGQSVARLERANDWHYADAAMNVTVKSGAEFELGSHARLTGKVTVEDGATYTMRESVQSRYEYVEGGVKEEDTSRYADYYGHKGDIQLDGSMVVAFSEGTSATTTHKGNISGNGSLSVTAGTSSGIFVLDGDNSGFTGSKELISGGLIGEMAGSLGETTDNKWKLGTEAWIASHADSSQTLLERVDASSTGTLALSFDTEQQLDLSSHSSLFLGAETGKTVQYGTLGTTEALTAYGNTWRLGGGGGELVVNFRLVGDNDLVLGATENSTGVVTLTNTENNFTGSITFTGVGVVLNALDGTLGDAKVDLLYGNAFAAQTADSIGKNLNTSSSGLLLADKFADSDVDLSQHSSLALGAMGQVNLSGNLTVADGADYRLGAVNGGTLTVQSALAAGHNLVVDAQGMLGGTVVLAGNESFADDITVQGHRDNDGSGNITLALGQDMTVTGNLAVEEGGVLDVAGHELTVNRNLSDNGGVFDDSVGTGALVFDTSAGDLSSDATLNMENVRKSGANTLSLGGSNGLSHFYVDAGTLALASDNALATDSTVHLANSTTLDTQSHALSADVAVAADNEAHIINSNATQITINGEVNMVEGSRLILGDSADSNAILAGNVSLESDSSISFHAGSTASLKAESVAGAEGSIVVTDGTLSFERSGNSTIEGTLEMNGEARLESRGYTNSMNRNISHLSVGGGKVTLWELTWNTIWNIDSLSGSGELLWDSSTNHYKASHLVLSGDGGFTGAIELNRDYRDATHFSDGNSARTHSAYIELASDTAAKNATLQLTGYNANNVASLAVNTDNASIKGLAGNEHSFVYAGAARESAAISGESRPETTRAATLTIDADADKTYTYAGALGNSSDTATNGLSLVKTGAGTQSFTGTATVSNVTVNQGTLNLTTADIKGDVTVTQGTLGLENGTIGGDINLHTGATLNKNELSLDAGQALHVKAGSSGTTAALGGSLVLNGGSLNFESEAISASAAALAVSGGVSYASGVSTQTVNLDSYRNLQNGATYTLASGDWSGVASDSVTINNLGYFKATAGTDANGLQMTVGLADNVRVWSASKATWETSNFDSNGALSTSSIAVFDDSGSYKSVTVSHWTSEVAEMVFNSSANYSIVSKGDNAMYRAQTGKLTLVGDGTLTLNSGIHVTGETIIDNGRLILKSTGEDSWEARTNWLSGKVSGTGTLEVDWGTGTTGTLDLGDLENLVVTSGTLQTASTAMNDSASITVASGAELQYTAATAGRVSPNHYGEGAVSLKMTGGADGYSNKLNLGEEFAGDTYVTAGNLSLTGAEVGKTLHLSGGVNAQFDGNSTSTEDFDLELAGTSQIHANSGSISTLTGKVSGASATYDSRGGGTVHFKGGVDLGAFTQTEDSTKIHFDSATKIGTLTVTNGSVNINSSAEVGTLVQKGTHVNLAQGSALKVGEATFSVGRSQHRAANEADSGAVSASLGTSAASQETYSLGSSSYTLTNGHMSVAASTDTEVNNQLTNSGIENVGSGKLTVNNAANELSGVYASSGDMAVLQAAAGLNLNELVVGAGLEVAAYTATEQVEAQEADISVRGTAHFGSGAKLNANLTLASGSTLSVAEGGVALGSTLSLQKGLTLDDATMASLTESGSHVLFTGVDSLRLATSETEYQEVSEADNSILASTYFKNIGSNYQLTYTMSENAADGGTLSITMAAVPEPTTTTLSLLALAALTARRRRK